MSSLLKQVVDNIYPAVVRGEGVFLYDADGNKYLDGSSGAMTASIGHGVPEIAEAMAEQARTIAFSYRTQFTNLPAEELADILVSRAPGDLNYAFFVNSGSEASEYAIRATVNHWRMKGHPDKQEILSRNTSYHGMTMGALSLSGHSVRRSDYGTLLHPFPVAPPADMWHEARPAESESEYAERSVDEYEQAIVKYGAHKVGAIVVEPIVGAAGGVLVPPRGYMKKLREMCDRLDILMIVDEVITGMGRTGVWFASEEEDIVPDILTFGKGLSGGYSPVAGVLLRDHMVATMREGSGISPFGHTFSNNPLGAAVCLSVLKYMEDHDVLNNVRRQGELMERGLQELAKKYPNLINIRGRGLLWGFDLAPRSPEGEDLPPVKVTGAEFVDVCFANGLIVYPAGIAPANNSVLISPPLTITREEIDLLLQILEQSLEEFFPRG